MAKKSDKIILIDADVVSHFISGSEILSINNIFPYEIKLLDKVYAELIRFPKKKREVENIINLNILSLIDFPEDNDAVKKEYNHIKKMMFKGDGESACLALVRYSQNILASSNLTDIKHYCDMHKISYLTTMDFLCYALKTGIWTEVRCNSFITAVLASGSRLPTKSIGAWNCRTLDFIS